MHTPMAPQEITHPAHELDPELEALPAPPATRRFMTLTTMAFVVVVALGMALSTRRDVAYFFSRAEATDLGTATSLDERALRPDTFATVRGAPMAAYTVRVRRPIVGDEYVVFPLAGQRDVFVQLPASDVATGSTEFVGRLTTFDAMGSRMGAVRTELSRVTGRVIGGESFVLVAGDVPGRNPVSLLFCALCLLIVVVDVALILRWFRPIQPERS